jgi:hypothetical protein
MKIQLKRSSVLDGGAAKAPLDEQMEYGELALNYNASDPSIFIKNSTNEVIKLVGNGSITDQAQAIVPESIAPPSNPLPGNLWFNPTEGRLFIYYQDVDSNQWVDASPDDYDPSTLPDLDNSAVQPGTTDGRYLMLNCANDPLTGNLQVNGGVTVDNNIVCGGTVTASNITSLTTALTAIKAAVSDSSTDDAGKFAAIAAALASF